MDNKNVEIFEKIERNIDIFVNVFYNKGRENENKRKA